MDCFKCWLPILRSRKETKSFTQKIHGVWEESIVSNLHSEGHNPAVLGIEQLGVYLNISWSWDWRGGWRLRPSRELICKSVNLKSDQTSSKQIFQTSILGFHFSVRGCTSLGQINYHRLSKPLVVLIGKKTRWVITFATRTCSFWAQKRNWRREWSAVKGSSPLWWK